MLKSPRRARLRHRTLVSAALLSGLCACGGVTQFSDTSPIKVHVPATKPAEPPPPAPKPKKRVEVKADRIEINEKIQFALDKADILPESHSLLDEVVAALKEHANITKLEIVGHTDNEGSDQYNMDLSNRRAKSVMDYLTGHGIAASRLTSKGMGETQPIADNNTPDGREKNRRVEFLILEQKKGGAK